MKVAQERLDTQGLFSRKETEHGTVNSGSPSPVAGPQWREAWSSGPMALATKGPLDSCGGCTAAVWHGMALIRHHVFKINAVYTTCFSQLIYLLSLLQIHHVSLTQRLDDLVRQAMKQQWPDLKRVQELLL